MKVEGLERREEGRKGERKRGRVTEKEREREGQRKRERERERGVSNLLTIMSCNVYKGNAAYPMCKMSSLRVLSPVHIAILSPLLLFCTTAPHTSSELRSNPSPIKHINCKTTSTWRKNNTKYVRTVPFPSNNCLNSSAYLFSQGLVTNGHRFCS